VEHREEANRGYDDAAGRLVLDDSAKVFWSDPIRPIEER
jgi:hypothetical protein